MLTKNLSAVTIYYHCSYWNKKMYTTTKLNFSETQCIVSISSEQAIRKCLYVRQNLICDKNRTGLRK